MDREAIAINNSNDIPSPEFELTTDVSILLIQLSLDKPVLLIYSL